MFCKNVSSPQPCSSASSSCSNIFSFPKPHRTAVGTKQFQFASTSTSSINSTSHSSLSSSPSFLPSSPSLSRSKNIKRPLCKNNSNIMSFIDKLNDHEEDDLNEALSKLIFGCNLPLRLVDSVHFKNFIKKLRPAYADKIPGRKALSTTLLDNAYKKCISSAKACMSTDSVLLIDGWKNCASNAKTIVSMLHNANGEQAFLQAWDMTGDSETADKLAEIVAESVDIAKELYSSNVYAVVSDNASAMVKMGKLAQHFIWHSNCSSHTGNLFAKDILNKQLTDKVTSVLKEFKQPDFEKCIIEKGGSRIKLPCDTRWCSYRDSYQCLIQNLSFIKCVTAESKVKKIKQNVAKLIFDDEFIEDVKNNIELFNPICELINTCQSSECSAADAVNLWLNLKLPVRFEHKFGTSLQLRIDMALNKYALTAFYLHPTYDNDKLSNIHKDKINNFLFKELNCTGIEEWDSFRNKTSFFKNLYEKGIKKPLVFWNMAAMKLPTLSNLAIKLLQIPASSAQIERVFSSWSYVHSPIRNRLTFDRSKKLLHVYYSLRIQDDFYEDDDDDE